MRWISTKQAPLASHGYRCESRLLLADRKMLIHVLNHSQNTIAQLTEDLETWATGLPKGFDFFNRSILSENRYEQQRNTLEILYHNTRILVTRPCLCRLDRRIKDQTVRSSEFNQRAALACVDSARSIAGLLPDDPEKNLSVWYERGPWWNMVHTIMQTLVILLLELSHGHVQPAQSQEIITSLKKLVRWLRAMFVVSLLHSLFTLANFA